MLNNVYQLITVDRHVSGREPKRPLLAAKSLHIELMAVYNDASNVILGAALENELHAVSWQEIIGEWFDYRTQVSNNVGNYCLGIEFQYSG